MTQSTVVNSFRSGLFAVVHSGDIVLVPHVFFAIFDKLADLAIMSRASARYQVILLSNETHIAARD